MAKSEVKACGIFVVLFVVGAVLILAFAFLDPVRVTVDEATLNRFALAASNNHTGTAALSYELVLVVTVGNHNWAMHASRMAPLDAELRFAGRTFNRFRLAGPADWRRIWPLEKMVYRFTGEGLRIPVALGHYGAVELARESDAGVFELELVVSGQFKYDAHFHRRGLRVSCLLDLSISTATALAPFDGVACT